MSIFAFAVAVLGTNGLAQVYKNAQSKYGDTKMHVAIAILAITAALIVNLFGQTETYKVIVTHAGEVFASAIALYEVVWKKLGTVVAV